MELDYWNEIHAIFEMSHLDRMVYVNSDFKSIALIS